jgi:hypothetical protein
MPALLLAHATTCQEFSPFEAEHVLLLVRKFVC